MNQTAIVVDNETNCLSLADALSFKLGEDALFVGRRQGFPVGFKCIASTETLLILFQVRHLRQADAKELSNLHYTGEVDQLVADNTLEIEPGDKIVWISFKNASEMLNSGSVPRLLDDILTSFVKADLGGNTDVCHYCQRNHVESPSCHDGRVTQVCDVCLSERLSAPANRPVEATEGALPVFILASLGALIGAVGWAVYWMGYELLFEYLGTKKIFVPRLVEMIALALAAVLTGGPVGFVIKRISRRGRRLSLMATILYTLAAVAAGEVLLIVWLIYREFKVFSPGIAWKILPQLELDSGVFHLIIKLSAAICAMVLAAEMAKPAKPKLNL